MPTHKDLPDWYLDAPTNKDVPDWFLDAPTKRRPRRIVRTAIALTVLVSLSLFATRLIARTTTTGATAPPRTAPALPGTGPPIPMSDGIGTRKLGSSAVSSARVRQTTSAGPAPRLTRAVHAPAPSGSAQQSTLLAIGTSLPGSGRMPELRTTAYRDSVTVHSRSPVPVVVSVSDGYAHPIRYLLTLVNGQSQPQTLVTGKSYGCCFSQAAGAGYAATRGCGSLVMHQYLNGVKVPDGAAAITEFLFARGRS